MPQQTLQITVWRSVCTIGATTWRTGREKWLQPRTCGVFFLLCSVKWFLISGESDAKTKIILGRMCSPRAIVCTLHRIYECSHGTLITHHVQVIIWWIMQRLSNIFSLNGRLNKNRALIVYSSSKMIWSCNRWLKGQFVRYFCVVSVDQLINQVIDFCSLFFLFSLFLFDLAVFSAL